MSATFQITQRQVDDLTRTLAAREGDLVEARRQVDALEASLLDHVRRLAAAERLIAASDLSAAYEVLLAAAA